MTFAALVRQEPVLLSHVGLTTVVISALAFYPGLHLTPAEAASIATIATAVTSIAAAFLTAPANIGVVHTAVTTILVAAASFGLHLSASNVAVFTTVIVTVLGYLLREKVSPVAGVK